jgi:E3 ubiquitin-protein ligase synoviolin
MIRDADILASSPAQASTALAAAVITSAFYQRANFYSAMVHLSQSNLSLMVRRSHRPLPPWRCPKADSSQPPLQVLVNLVFVVYSSFIYLLQRLCFGPLRPAEIEQLYEKGWFAITETCLAMTIFRDEVGAFFLIMFTALITGKVWGWIGEGRVEVLEQQPPANPVWFHARLSFSLLVSIVYDVWLLAYIVRTVVEEARPTMMVMFLFEFAVLTVSSLHTAARYIVSLVEMHVTKTQTRQRLEDRRRRLREQREEILRRREAGDAAAENEELPDPDAVDEMDIEVPGWEGKGQWVLSLDLFTGMYYKRERMSSSERVELSC